MLTKCLRFRFKQVLESSSYLDAESSSYLDHAGRARRIAAVTLRDQRWRRLLCGTVLGDSASSTSAGAGLAHGDGHPYLAKTPPNHGISTRSAEWSVPYSPI